MTIALGFQAKGGIVLCADMQKTIGEMKTYDGKVDLHIFHQTGVMVAIAGAGHDDYIHTATTYVLEGLAKHCRWSTLETDLKTRLLSFFDEHLSRWAYFPLSDRPTVELLIGHFSPVTSKPSEVRRATVSLAIKSLPCSFSV